jgi:hypothetical protein
VPPQNQKSFDPQGQLFKACSKHYSKVSKQMTNHEAAGYVANTVLGLVIRHKIRETHHGIHNEQ